jgi:TIGR03009 family protein
MMHRREIVRLIALILAASGSQWACVAVAQGQPGTAQLQPAPQAQPPQAQQPQSAQAQAEEYVITAAAEQLLQFWEQKSSDVHQLYGEFERYSYDSTFGIEKRAVGRLWFAAPDRGRIDIAPSEQVPAEPNNINPDKLTEDGRPYQVVADRHERWICNGQRVFAIVDSDQTYAEMTIPPQFQGENIINSPLPFLFGMQAARAKERYYIYIGPMHNPDGRIEGAALNVHVVVYPRWEQDAREWSSAEILLNPENFLPNAVRILAGNNEEVYVFTRAQPAIVGVNLWNRDPFNDTPPGNYTCIDRQTAGAPVQSAIERSASAPPSGQAVIPR